jgi:HAD superfamily hydrolase (TIGR01509 family)
VYRAVVFDFGNVLCRIDRAAMNAAIAVHTALSPDEIGAILWGSDLERDSETGRYDSRTHFALLKKRLNAHPSWNYEDFSFEFMNGILPNPDGEEALQAARERGLRTFILSNTSYLHSRWIFENEILASLPELHVFSYKVGFMKPDPRIWLRLLEYARLESDDCLYVDDMPEYCAVASALGFGTIRYAIDDQNLVEKLILEIE